MKKIKYNNTYIYIDDEPVDEKETGILIPDKDSLKNTMKLQTITNDDLLENTLTNIWSDSNE